MTATDWYDDDRFWALFGDCMFHPETFARAAEELPAIIALGGIPVARVLDLGCGPGRHAVPFAEAGLAVTGVDLSRTLLDQGRARAAEAGVEVEWIEGDMRHFDRPGGFELILSLWTSFGYFEDPADDLALLERCLANLSPGGAFIVDVAGKEIILRDIEPVHLTEYDDGRILVERPTLSAGMDRYENEWILIDGGEAHRASWHHNLYSARELVTLFEQAGFVDIGVAGSLEGDAYDLEAERLVVVGHRPAD